MKPLHTHTSRQTSEMSPYTYKAPKHSPFVQRTPFKAVEVAAVVAVAAVAAVAFTGITFFHPNEIVGLGVFLSEKRRLLHTPLGKRET